MRHLARGIGMYFPHPSKHSNDVVPLIGTVKVEFDVFQFYIGEISDLNLLIRIPDKLPNALNLKHLDLINFHLAFRKRQSYYAHGRVDQIEYNRELKEAIYTISLIEDIDDKAPVVIEIEQGNKLTINPIQHPREVIHNSVKNLLLLKQGVGVYLKHLSTYFSRLIGYSLNRYPEFCEFFFDTLKRKIDEKIANISNRYDYLKDLTTTKDICENLDFEFYTSYVESEVNLDILNIAFGTDAHLPYIVAIKELEESMYQHYNILVLLEQKLRHDNYPETFKDLMANVK